MYVLFRDVLVFHYAPSFVLLVSVNSRVSLAPPTFVLVHDEVVDNVVLYGVHGKWEYEEGEGDLQGFVAFGPTQGPVTDPGEEGHGKEEEEDKELHTNETDAVDEQLLEIPFDVGGRAIVTRLDRFRRVGERGTKKEVVEDFEQ